MRLQAEVHCYHCGQIAGTWQWPAAVSPTWGLFRSPGSKGWARLALHQIHCARCGGPVFLDEVAPVVVRPPTVIPPARRGRPRREARELAS